MNNDEFKVPYGRLANGQLVKPTEANKTSRYFCPGCSCELIFKSGSVLSAHFAHRAEGACTGESVLHKTAKALLVQTVRQHAKARLVNLVCVCEKCQNSFVKKLPSNAFEDAFEEVKVGKRICDVVTCKDGEANLAIEVLATHAVDEMKASDLDIFWIELTASDVIANPHIWRPMQSRLKPQTCSKCAKLQSELKSLQIENGLREHPAANHAKAPYPPYLVAKDICYSCKKTVPVYWWQGVPFCQQSPPEPRPKTLQFRYSKKYGGKYWMNTCAACGAPSGDNFLFLESNAPFQHLPLVRTDEMKPEEKRQTTKLIKHMLRNF